MEILSFENVSYRYNKQSKKIIRNSTIKFEEGKIYSIIQGDEIDPKVILALLAGFDTCSSGKILYKNKDITTLDINDYRSKNISIILCDYEFLESNIESLSIYEKKKLAINKAILDNPDVILIEKPTENMELKEKKEIINILKNYVTESRKCVILTTKSRELSKGIDEFWGFSNGKLLFVK